MMLEGVPQWNKKFLSTHHRQQDPSTWRALVNIANAFSGICRGLSVSTIEIMEGLEIRHC